MTDFDQSSSDKTGRVVPVTISQNLSGVESALFRVLTWATRIPTGERNTRRSPKDIDLQIRLTFGAVDLGETSP
jgi:hypothetical protein